MQLIDLESPFIEDIIGSANVLSLGWLPVKERIEFNLIRLARKSLRDATWFQYLRLELYTNSRQLRADDTLRLKIPFETGTFQDCSAKIFNELPVFIRNDENNLF